MRFLLDGMLGSLTRWLRICGYDAEYLRDAEDDELIRRAAEERRILLTRDKSLYRKALRQEVQAHFVAGESDAERLASVAARFGLRLKPEASRCPMCGSPLRQAGREEVRDRVPEGTFNRYQEFWLCERCGRVYWRGSHWSRIVETIKEAERLYKGSRGSGGDGVHPPGWGVPR